MDGARAMVIDDNLDTCHLLRSALSGRWHTYEAHTLSDGVELARRLLPSVIFLDVHFRGGDLTGIDYLRRLELASPDSRVIVITSEYSESEAKGVVEGHPSVFSYAEKGDLSLLIGLADAAHRAYCAHLASRLR